MGTTSFHVSIALSFSTYLILSFTQLLLYSAVKNFAGLRSDLNRDSPLVGLRILSLPRKRFRGAKSEERGFGGFSPCNSLFPNCTETLATQANEY